MTTLAGWAAFHSSLPFGIGVQLSSSVGSLDTPNTSHDVWTAAVSGSWASVLFLCSVTEEDDDDDDWRTATCTPWSCSSASSSYCKSPTNASPSCSDVASNSLDGVTYDDRSAADDAVEISSKLGVCRCRCDDRSSSSWSTLLSTLSTRPCHVNTRQLSYRKKTARCVQYMGALKIFESPHYAPGYFWRNL